MIVANRETSLEAVVGFCILRCTIHSQQLRQHTLVQHLRSWLIMEFALACRYLVTPA